MSWNLKFFCRLRPSSEVGRKRGEVRERTLFSIVGVRAPW